MALYDSTEAILALSNIDPEFEEHVRLYRSPPPTFTSLADLREDVINKQTKKFMHGAQFYDLEEQKIDIPTRDGFSNEALVFRPKSSPSSHPTALVVIVFGGGFISGTNMQLAAYARGITKLYGATTVCISYRVAPEHPFPTATNDVWDATQWLMGHTAELGVDLKKGFVLGGGSAGANLACVTAHRTVAEKMQPPVTGIWACMPALLPEAIVPEVYKDRYLARKQNGIVPGGFLDDQAIAMTLAAYQPDNFSVDFSPFNRPETFASMPPTYIQVAGLDPLRDDGLIYDHVLRENNVKTKLDVYPGVPHGFSEIGSLKQTKKFRSDIFHNFGWLLGKEASSASITSILDIPELTDV